MDRDGPRRGLSNERGVNVRRRLLWRVFPYYVIIIVASLGAIGYYGARQLQTVYLEKVTEELQGRAYLVRYQLASLIQQNDRAQLVSECREMGQLSHTRITIVTADGKVLADSEEDATTMENHSTRPEIMAAYRGGVGTSMRYSHTLHQQMKYVAIPVETNGQIVAVVRTSFAVTTIHEALTHWTRNIILAGLVILLLAGGISYAVVTRLNRPLTVLKSGADRIAAGEFGARVPAMATEEMGVLASAMNNMANQLEKRIQTISEQRNEREAILANMTEGVLALDGDGKIISMNRAAAESFGAQIERARGRGLTEVMRNAELYELAEQVLNTGKHAEGEIVIPGDRNRYLQVKGAPLPDSEGRQGAVIVINDISRLKQLERMRQDFVGNVSHELRTPITAIIGSIETLIDGEVSRPEDVRRFLEIVAKHADRLNTIVADLLALSRLENESERGGLSLRRGSVDRVIEAAVAVCEQKGKAQQVSIEAPQDTGLEADIDAAKLEQAVINLLDNAIKASKPGSKVEIGVSSTDKEIQIAVTDTGSGIEAKHLPRLFERFYRVDTARSRERGGTGLGLAIVKHTALGHGGRVTVDSTWGQGSTFRIWLPRPVDDPGRSGEV